MDEEKKRNTNEKKVLRQKQKCMRETPDEKEEQKEECNMLNAKCHVSETPEEPSIKEAFSFTCNE
jgi:hypothetical protein